MAFAVGETFTQAALGPEQGWNCYHQADEAYGRVALAMVAQNRAREKMGL